LASPGLSSVNVEKSVASFYSDHLAQQLQQQAQGGLQVVTSSEIATLLGFERQRQLMGCSDEVGSCMAELANALGVDGIVTGSVGRFGSTFQVNLKVVASRDGSSLAIFSGSSDEAGVLALLTQAARSLAREVLSHFGRVLAEPVVAPARRYSWVPLAAGVAALGVGTFAVIRAKTDYDTLYAGRDSQGQVFAPSRAEELRRDGNLFQPLGIALVATAGVCLATAAGLYLWKSDGQSVAVTLIAGDRTVGIAGAFP
jgi:TolB-like protein